MKKSLSALTVVGITAASLVALAPTASASGCVSTWLRSPGTTTNGAMVATKADSPCHDLNVSWSQAAPGAQFSQYMGMYRKSSSVGWQPGSRGYVQMENGYHDINNSYFALVTDLTPGTQFTVISRNPGDQVTIVH
ncbi:hypothetical protein [Streptomyces violascens]|uniref:Secreted protein n=1 Tax=Streptomyces violascens TaxID=67381 RepID=A0ABQ3QGX2_9ACTN|nr:hypothetical protein [Streptomyces violascens]GGT90292.1 hypothetical protein GCM10010289_08090 [Streptomyces violascens]GHI36474.1 hypothetical protein Sviol_08820 [Streptomyces violascens]